MNRLSAILFAVFISIAANAEIKKADASAGPEALRTLFASLQPGDTLYIKGGQYDFTAPIDITASGTVEQMICIMAYPGEEPILDFRREPYGKRGLVIHSSSNYIHIKGLTIRYTGKNGLHNSGSHNIFEDLDVYGNGDTGIQMKAGGDNLILNCDSHDNFDYMLSGDFGGNADGFADKQYTGGGNIYRGCRSWNNSDDGWDFYQRVSIEGTKNVIEDCICFNNGPKEYDMRSHPRYETDKEWFDSFTEGRQVTFRDGVTRTVTLEHYYNNGNRNGFKLGGKNTIHNVELHNCTATGNGSKGFDQNNNAGHMLITDCTASANGLDYGFENRTCGTLEIHGCCSIGGRSILNCLQVLSSGNSWD